MAKFTEDNIEKIQERLDEGRRFSFHLDLTLTVNLLTADQVSIVNERYEEIKVALGQLRLQYTMDVLKTLNRIAGFPINVKEIKNS